MDKVRPNPYTPGAPIQEPDRFFGRDALFEFLRTALIDGRVYRTCVLYGERRVGKTSISMQILNGRLGPDCIPVYLSLEAVVDYSSDQFLAHLAGVVTEQLRDRVGIDLDEAARSDDRSRPSGTFGIQRDLLRRALQALDGRTLLLMFDEYHLIGDKTLRGQDQQLFNWLSYLIESENHLALLFLGTKRLEDVTEAQFPDLYEACVYKKITYLDATDARQLVTEPARGLLEYDDAAIDDIYRLTAGHPYLVNFMCAELFFAAQEEGRTRVGSEHVKTVLDRVLQNPPPSFIHFYQRLTDRHRVLVSILCQRAGDGPFDTASLQREARRFGYYYQWREINELLERLRELELVRTSGQQLVWRLELMRRWIAASEPVFPRKLATLRDPRLRFAVAAVVLMLVAVAFVLRGVVSGTREVQLRERAADAVQTGKWDVAAIRYADLVQLRPHNVTYRLSLAQALEQTGRLDSAAGVLEEGRLEFTSGPDGTRVLLALAGLAADRGDTTTALVWMDSVEQRATGRLPQATHLDIGQALEELNRPRGAIGRYRQGLGAGGSLDPHLLLGLARCHLAEYATGGTPEDSVQATQSARQVAESLGSLPGDSISARMHRELATIYETLGDPDLARDHYRRAADLTDSLELHGESHRVRVAWARLEWRAGSIDTGVGMLASVEAEAYELADSSLEAAVREMLGDWVRDEQPDRAIREYQRSLELVAAPPDSVRLLAKLADLERRRGRADRALDLYAVATAMDPTDVTLWERYGDAQRAAGRLPAALTSYTRALAGPGGSDSARITILWRLAVAYRELGQFRAASERADEALTLARRSVRAALPSGLIRSGTLRAELGDTENARELCDEARQMLGETTEQLHVEASGCIALALAEQAHRRIAWELSPLGPLGYGASILDSISAKYHEAVDASAEALRRAQAAGMDSLALLVHRARYLSALGVLMLIDDDAATMETEYLDTLNSAIGLASQLHDRWERGRAEFHRALAGFLVALAVGEHDLLAAASDSFEANLGDANTPGHARDQPTPIWFTALAHLLSGDLLDARRLSRRGLRVADETSDSLAWKAQFYWLLAVAHAASGDYEQAEVEYLRAGRTLSARAAADPGDVPPEAHAFITLNLSAVLEEHDRPKARELLRSATERFDTIPDFDRELLSELWKVRQRLEDGRDQTANVRVYELMWESSQVNPWLEWTVPGRTRALSRPPLLAEPCQNGETRAKCEIRLLLALGGLYATSDRGTEAKGYFETARRIARDSGDLHGQAEAELGLGATGSRLGDAFASYGRADSLAAEAPDSGLQARALVGMARTWANLGQLDSARNLYEQANAVAPQEDTIRTVILTERASVVDQSTTDKRDPQAAAAAYSQVFDTATTDSVRDQAAAQLSAIYNALARQYVREGDFQRARAALDDAVRWAVESNQKTDILRRELAGSCFSRSRRLLGSGDSAQAIQWARHALEIDSTYPEPYVRLVEYHVDREELEVAGDYVAGALPQFDAAFRLDTTEVTADQWNLLCWYGALLGYAGRVLDACDRAVRPDTTVGYIRDSRGVARALTGDVRGAIRDFEAFLEWSVRTERQAEFREQRGDWVERLGAGEDPLTVFTREVLAELLRQ